MRLDPAVAEESLVNLSRQLHEVTNVCTTAVSLSVPAEPHSHVFCTLGNPIESLVCGSMLHQTEPPIRLCRVWAIRLESGQSLRILNGTHCGATERFFFFCFNQKPEPPRYNALRSRRRILSVRWDSRAHVTQGIRVSDYAVRRTRVQVDGPAVVLALGTVLLQCDATVTARSWPPCEWLSETLDPVVNDWTQSASLSWFAEHSTLLVVLNGVLQSDPVAVENFGRYGLLHDTAIQTALGQLHWEIGAKVRHTDPVPGDETREWHYVRHFPQDNETVSADGSAPAVANGGDTIADPRSLYVHALAQFHAYTSRGTRPVIPGFRRESDLLLPYGGPVPNPPRSIELPWAFRCGGCQRLRIHAEWTGDDRVHSLLINHSNGLTTGIEFTGIHECVERWREFGVPLPLTNLDALLFGGSHRIAHTVEFTVARGALAVDLHGVLCVQAPSAASDPRVLVSVVFLALNPLALLEEVISLAIAVGMRLIQLFSYDMKIAVVIRDNRTLPTLELPFLQQWHNECRSRFWAEVIDQPDPVDTQPLQIHRLTTAATAAPAVKRIAHRRVRQPRLRRVVVPTPKITLPKPPKPTRSVDQTDSSSSVRPRWLIRESRRRTALERFVRGRIDGEIDGECDLDFM